MTGDELGAIREAVRQELRRQDYSKVNAIWKFILAGVLLAALMLSYAECGVFSP